MEVKYESIEQRIINASFRILEREGNSGVTTKKIANEAEVSEVTLFRKFKSKKGLLLAVKKHYTEYLISRLNEIFAYTEDMDLEDYLKDSFNQVVNLSDNEINIIKVYMEDVRRIENEKTFLSQIADIVIERLTGFFRLQISNNKIRNVNPSVLALNIYSIIFESIVLWKVYGKEPIYPINKYIDDFLDIITNGISINEKEGVK